MNTDQGSQFTARNFIDVLRAHKSGISMDGKGSWRDNVFVERLWKTIKYEHVYLHAHESVADARAKLAVYIDIYKAVARIAASTGVRRTTCISIGSR